MISNDKMNNGFDFLHIYCSDFPESGVSGVCKTLFNCEIAALEGNFDHEIRICTERPFNVTDLTFCDVLPLLLIDLIG